ncbi:cytochrome b/b6 domain-containing protein [Paracoccus sp. P2]|uniref:Cytochrome B n=1 Tax=Paracoccus pantotrophus TaxID=82367 RepID=A0A1I5DZX8_PARPN|nr:cytochrome b/b6 domain-containing protein [Paracoccus pantotrophus]MDF3853277.1 cytochrome b/b6 domain-containing protein [Paracoccus pantotrophus]QFG36822.1 cytochrome B [Paracoccus pantotrophus]QLH14390.1 cytochrome b/b6 domain-containing protein [Paracoccus pantotrophus]RDD96088.1 cytochrome B [Paracoccus pantotrophus]RKS52772.1 cytochrome b [Paracoccus pantotrophus]
MKGPVREVRLWDPLLRGFHWLLAFFVIAAWCLGQFGPAKMTLHFWCGYVVAGLLVFRLVWGFVGPAPARFSHFIRGPGAIAGYMRGLLLREPSYWPGHNPLGALSVLAMLAVLAAQVSSGLISDPDDYINVGPLASYVSGTTRSKAVGWHNLGANLVLVLVLLHVAVILFYRYWKREDLVRPMITGRKQVREE